MQSGVSAQPQSIANGEVVIPQDSEGTQRRLQAAQRLGDRFDVPIAFVDVVASECDHVGFGGQGSIDDLLEIFFREMVAAMKVGQVRDAQPFKGFGKFFDGNREFGMFEPGWLDLIGIAQSGPGTPDPAGEKYVRRSWSW